MLAVDPTSKQDDLVALVISVVSPGWYSAAWIDKTVPVRPAVGTCTASLVDLSNACPWLVDPGTGRPVGGHRAGSVTRPWTPP